MNVLDLFSGIGGFSLGLERAGPFRTVAFCERSRFPRAVLAQHWPGVPIYCDIRRLTAARLRADGLVRPDLVCGGFPCQDISAAGRGAGIDGARSGLWREMARVIDEVRPRWVVVENSPALRIRGADRVLGDLEALGYTCWPLVVGAVHAGAWHRRQRVWVVAHAVSVEHEIKSQAERRPSQRQLCAADVAVDRWRSGRPRRPDPGSSRERESERPLSIVSTHADGVRSRQQGWRQPSRPFETEPADNGADGNAVDVDPQRREGAEPARSPADWGRRLADATAAAGRGRPAQSDLVRVVHGLPPGLDGRAWLDWHSEPNIPRTATNVPHRAARIMALGNAVVPQVVEMIGCAILTLERADG